MEEGILTKEEKAALMAEDDEVLEREVAKEEKSRARKRTRKSFMKWALVVTAVAGISYPLGLKKGYKQKAKEIEKEIYEIYSEAKKDAKKISDEMIKNTSLETRKVSNLMGGKDLLSKLESDGVISKIGRASCRERV